MTFVMVLDRREIVKISRRCLVAGDETRSGSKGAPHDDFVRDG